MHKIERELIEATNFKPRQKYADRQDYLKSLFLATTKMTNEDFDDLTDPAADWVNECVQLHNSQKHAEFPDFDDFKASSKDEDEADEEAADDESEDASEDEDDGEDEASEGPNDGDDEEPDEDEDESDDEGDVEEDAEQVEEASVREPNEDEETRVLTKPKKSKPSSTKPAKPTEKLKVHGNGPLKYVEGDATQDKWGCLDGSKNSRALAMFEKGATSREVKNALGGTYYNILAKMVKNGHQLVKDGSVITLTHKDAVRPKVKPKK